MDVVIDQQITILQVLPLRDTVGSDQQINLSLLWHGADLVPVFGARGEVGEDLIEVCLAKGGAVGFGASRD